MVMEVLEIKHLKDKTLTFSHKEKGHHYKVLDIVKSKHSDTGKWYDAVIYKQIENKTIYVRSINSFIENFYIVNKNNNNFKNKTVMNKYIKNLVETNEQATEAIKSLESTINSIEIETEKDKANFGNLCIVLKGYRMVAEGTECLLRNEGIFKGADNKFYTDIKNTLLKDTKDVADAMGCSGKDKEPKDDIPQ